MAEATDTGAGGAETFDGYLDLPQGDGKSLALSQIELVEGYNAGWHGGIVLAMRTQNTTSSAFMSMIMGEGARPGSAATIRVAVGQGDVAQDVRTWPVAIGRVEPVETGDPGMVACSLQVSDPLTHLQERPIWGAYRGCSVGEMIGGAVSMAAGSDGKPTLAPVLPGLAPVTIRTAHREALNSLEYAIAAGETLGDWLAEVSGLLGIRIEMLGTAEGDVSVYVTDMAPATDEVEATFEGGDSSATAVRVTGMYGQPAPPIRAAVLDDITQGPYRRLGPGSVGTVISAMGVDSDEVAARVLATARGRSAETFVLSAATTEAGLRPGRVLAFDAPLRGVERWQVAGVRHRLAGHTYSNSLTLFVASIPWCPTPPPNRADVIVPGVVDGGQDAAMHSTVPRDRMGRIAVRLAFLPTDSAEELAQEEAADTNEDGEVTMDDFGASEFHDTEHWESEVESLRIGTFDDPFPGRDDEELLDEELAERETLASRRRGARRYLAWLEAKRRAEVRAQDRDKDGYLTARDSLVSDSLEEVLADDASREELVRWHDAKLAGTLDVEYPSLDGTQLAMVSEYDQLFGPRADASENPEVAAAAKEARIAQERWPVRLPLPVVQPMAGGLHGFVPAHRQGDACRVAVHGPFSAEVIGFQYREDRPINAQIEGATAGLVVEHDTGHAWSGIVFRPTEDLET